MRKMSKEALEVIKGLTKKELGELYVDAVDYYQGKELEDNYFSIMESIEKREELLLATFYSMAQILLQGMKRKKDEEGRVTETM